VAETPPAVRVRPRYRGVSHLLAFVVALVLCVIVTALETEPTARLAGTVFAASVAVMFGASALYHRVWWTPIWRRRMARIDHAAIYLLIAGTYTPIGLLVLSGAWRVVVLSIAWTGAVAAIALKIVWGDAPKWAAAAIAMTLGWVGVVAFPELLPLGISGTMLIAGGGVLYTFGGILYALRRPDPRPTVFGYHEIFHALVVGAVACHYVAVVFFVLPRA
jgi:hemolysin III